MAGTVSGVATQQDGQSVLRIGQQAFQDRQGGLGIPVQRSEGVQLERRDQTTVVTLIGQLGAFPQQVDVERGERYGPASFDDLEVGGNGRRNHGQPSRAIVGFRGEELADGRLGVVADLAPEVDLVGESQRSRVGGVVEPAWRGSSTASEDATQSDIGRRVGIRRVGVQVHLRIEVRPGDAVALPDFLDPGHRFPEIEVGGQGGVDQSVEHRVVVDLPPAERLAPHRLRVAGHGRGVGPGVAVRHGGDGDGGPLPGSHRAAGRHPNHEEHHGKVWFHAPPPSSRSP
jgi:hypothetical protein